MKSCSDESDYFHLNLAHAKTALHHPLINLARYNYEVKLCSFGTNWKYKQTVSKNVMA